MKPSIIATALLFGTVLLSAKENKSSNIPNNKTQEQPTPVTVTTVYNEKNGSPYAKGGEDYAPKWYASPEWWLVILGFPSLFIIALQTAVSSRAANAAQTSAIAAKESSDSLKAAERPWLFVIPRNKSYCGQPTEMIHWKIVNRGRTTAQVSQALVRCKVLRGQAKILKNPPHYEEGPKLQVDFFGVPVAPNGKIEGSSWIEGENGIADGITQKDIEDIQSTVADLVVYGRILYKGHTQGMETRFCYYYAPKFNDFRINLRAESEYHQCT